MGRFHQDGSFACFASLFQKLCLSAVAKPDFLGHFFQLFSGKLEWHHTGCGVCSEDGVAPATQYGALALYAGC